jgi:tRNA pseudouridine32 synthase/23S rRNA pseudouridine746 synthase
MKLIHEDALWLVLDKAPGWLTVPGRKGAEDPRPCLRTHAEAEYGPVWVVHRLDEPVSGLVIFARTADAHRIANMAFESRGVRKTYHAQTQGSAPGKTQISFRDSLRKGKKRSFRAPHGKQALTESMCKGGGEGAPLNWVLKPQTSRAHQLRVQLSLRGWPIMGDTLYGAEPTQEPGIALRAVALEGPFGAYSASGLF